MRIRFTILLMFMMQQSFAQSDSTLIPWNKQLKRSWYDNLFKDGTKSFSGNELNTIGMPVGGIAAGQLYIRGDGTLANWWIANNAWNTGYGGPEVMNFQTPLGPKKVCYQTYTPESYVEQGFGIKVKSASGKPAYRELSKKDFDKISFTGEYPIATIQYQSGQNAFPLNISLKACSPFIPLDARKSATPGTYLIFTITNTSKEKLSADLSGWLQNMVCLELKDKVHATSRNRVLQDDSITSLLMDVVPQTSTIEKEETIFDDFENNNYNNWTVSGNAFDVRPVSGTLADQSPVSGFSGNYLINSFRNGDSTTGKMVSKEFTIADDYINFLIGGGYYEGATEFSLWIDGKKVFAATGNGSEILQAASWNVSGFKNKKAHFQIIDSATGGWGHINLDRISFSNVNAEQVSNLSMHPYFGNMALSVLAKETAVLTNRKQKEKGVSTANIGDTLTGEVTVSLQLQPGETKQVVFVLSWYFPNRPMQYGGYWAKALTTTGPVIGNMYANWFSSSYQVAEWMIQNRERLAGTTQLFHDCYYKHSTLPYWLNRRIMMPVANLATETCQWWATDKFWAWEGVGSCDGTCTHVWNYEQALAHLFPELERNVREKTDFSTSFQQDGGILARNGAGGVQIDGHIGTILKSYREYLLSDNTFFLSRNWDKIKKATQYVISKDAADSSCDGLLTGDQPNTYDWSFYGANTFVGSLYLAALKAASQMALLMDERSFADSCSNLAEKGSIQSVKKLWNGRYFIQDVDAKKVLLQYGDGCLSDQVFGQTWAHLLDLGYIYPEQNIKQALASTWKYNWTPDVGAYNKIYPPTRFYANDKEPGLLICTWPMGDNPGKNGMPYNAEVWTGIEYQVATNMIYDGMIDEALSIVKSVDERYAPEKHNPWNEIECGDHYARSLASWGILLALQDFQYNGPGAALSFAPKINPENFQSFFTAAKGWGNFSQQRLATQQQNLLTLSYGELHLKQLALQIPPGKNIKSSTITINGVSITAVSTLKQDRVILSGFDQYLSEGDKLKVEINF